MIKDPVKRRKLHVRKKIKGTAEKPRVTVYKSLKALYAQAIDDLQGKTLASARVVSGKNQASATTLGEELAAALQAKQLSKICFDKNGYAYHGVVKAFAEALRSKGIQF